MQAHRYWHPKLLRLVRHLDVDVPRGYWFLFNKKGGTSRNLGVKKPYKGYGIVMFESREPILPIKSDSSDDDDGP